MRRVVFTLMVFSLLVAIDDLVAQAPSHHIVWGTLFLESGEVVVGANVLAISPADSTIISYSISGADGGYRLKVPVEMDRVILSVNSMISEDITTIIKNTNHKIDFVLKEKVTELREVEVTSPKVWGNSDTISYSVLQLSRANDKTISDVLRNIPGVKVESNGQIKYQGKRISHLYIEGIDLTQGRYALITENVLGKDISTVQILNNHNHIKALKKVRPSDEVAINLKMAESKQGIWATGANIGLGYDHSLLTNSKVSANYITKHNQHLIVGSIDNTGQPTGNELKVLAGHKGILTSDELKPISNIRKGVEPPINTEAYLDNLTTYGTNHNSFSLGADTQLKLSIDYLYDKSLSNSQMLSEYYGIGMSDIINTQEKTNASEKIHRLSGSLDFEVNKPSKYFNNNSSVYFAKSNANGVVVLDEMESIVQKQYINSYHIKNYTRYLGKESDIPLDIISTNQYRNGKEGFEVSLDEAIDVLQNANHTKFESDNYIAIPDMAFGKGWWYTPSIGISYSNQSVAVHEALSRDKLVETFAKQEFTFLSNKTSLRISIPIHYRVRKYDDHKYRNWSLEPSFYFKQDLGYMWQVILGSEYKKILPDMIGLYPGAIFIDYRTRIKSETKMYHKHHMSANVKVSHNDFMNLFSGYIRTSYMYQHAPVLQSYVASGNKELMMRLLPIDNTLSAWDIESSVSKGFLWKSLGITLILGYSNVQGQTALKDDVKDFTNQISKIMTEVKLSPLKQLVMDYRLQMNKSSFRVSNENSQEHFRINQILSVGGYLLSNIFCEMEAEHTYLKHPEVEKHFTLLGGSVQYKRSKWGLGFQVNNLMNLQNYVMIRNFEYGNSTTQYQLRPRSFLLTLDITL